MKAEFTANGTPKRDYRGAHCVYGDGRLATITGIRRERPTGVVFATLRHFDGSAAGSQPLHELEILERTYETQEEN